jgi:glycosyltransferase involved in cell wall biosynthesis
MALTDSVGPQPRRQPAVAVVHPGVQHSRELARALHEGGLLARFVTSSNGRFGRLSWLPAGYREALRRRVTDGVPQRMVSTMPYVEAAGILLRPLLGPALRARMDYAGLDLFDRLAAGAVRADARIVVGFESSCRHTFRRAKAEGLVCVLDAASVHHSVQAALDSRLSRRIVERKDEELRLADHVVVLSGYARDTYAAAGVPAERMSVVPPGIWLPDRIPARHDRGRGEAITFLFAGNVTRAKGIDLLLGAFRKLNVPDKALRIAGPTPEAGALPGPLPPRVMYLGKLSRDALFEAYARSDVLVLPSRGDGFGFVVAEAMAAGLPVIVSSAVGAKDLVVEGETGWMFESGSEAQLGRAMAQAAAHRGEVAEMGNRARRAVEALTWTAYGERVRALYRRLLEARADRAAE